MSHELSEGYNPFSCKHISNKLSILRPRSGMEVFSSQLRSMRTWIWRLSISASLTVELRSTITAYFGKHRPPQRVSCAPPTRPFQQACQRTSHSHTPFHNVIHSIRSLDQRECDRTWKVHLCSGAFFWTESTDSYRASASISSDPWFIMESNFATGIRTAVTKEMLIPKAKGFIGWG